MVDNNELNAAIELLAKHSRLLVASDFDGTLSSFTENPSEASLDRFAKVALRQLSDLPNTIVAIISGRGLGDLSAKFTDLEKVRLIGSHGHEFDLDKITSLTDEQRNVLKRAEDCINDAVATCPGSRIEKKPHGVVFHYRGAAALPETILDRLKAALGALGEGIIGEGNRVVEFCIVDTDKGDALIRLQEQLTPTITVFIGDDVTDESAFLRMEKSDISIKVGDGDSAATYRLHSTADVVRFLGQVAKRREEWMRGVSTTPIDRHLFLSDQRTLALVDDRGAVSWLCIPRLDGAPLFGALVGGAAAGQFRISAPGNVTQQYIGNTLIGKTTFDKISVTDFFDCSGDRTYQRAGRSDLIRLIEGSGEVEIEFAPKFNFGRVPTRLSSIPEGLRIECGQQRLVLISPGCAWEITREGNHDVARLKLVLKEECIPLVLVIGPGAAPASARLIHQMFAETQRFWEKWLATLQLPKIHTSLVARSAIVLRGLCFGPSGAIAAAATSSLPETIGGHRNWDYRYCWPRDACLSASALLRLNSPGPAIRLLDWILGIVIDAEAGQFFSPLYTVTGRTVPGEAEVPDAVGYRGSRPVRIGNLAAEQLQLDAVGPIAELMWKLSLKGATLTAEHLELAHRLVSMIESRWREADSGIWEVRGEQRHYVHSKIMCWYTVRCCSEVARYLGAENIEWKKLEDDIRAQIETQGYDENLQSYIAAYDLPEADAALAWIVLSGFHPPRHPRCLGTLSFIMRSLIRDGNVLRYQFNDSLYGQEGEFIICRCWLIEALVMTGDRAAAQRLLDVLIGNMGPLGLMAEEWDAKTRCALGNYPQAYSHLGFINSVCALERANA